MLFDLLQAAGIDSASMAEAAAQASDVIVPQQEEMHLLDMAMKGGWLMLVLLALSIVAIYIFGKKWWMIHQAGNIRQQLHERHQGLPPRRRTMKSAQSLCEKYDSPVARLVEKGISRIGRPLSDIQTAIENTGNTEVARLEKGLPILATIAGGAPMIGFLGTVLRYGSSLLQHVTGRKQHRHYPPFKWYLHGHDYFSRRSYRGYSCIFRIQLPHFQQPLTSCSRWRMRPSTSWIFSTSLQKTERQK